MEITVEISYYPLSSDYGDAVLDFIDVLKVQSGIRLRTNQMSTQVTGDIDQVMPAIVNTMKQVWSTDLKAPIVMKCFNEALDLDWLS